MIAATLAYFLLHGEGAKYRTSYVKLLETIHKVHDSPTSLTDCFTGVDRSKMQQEWESFVRGIVLDK